MKEDRSVTKMFSSPHLFMTHRKRDQLLQQKPCFVRDFNLFHEETGISAVAWHFIHTHSANIQVCVCLNVHEEHVYRSHLKYPLIIFFLAVNWVDSLHTNSSVSMCYRLPFWRWIHSMGDYL